MANDEKFDAVEWLREQEAWNRDHGPLIIHAEYERKYRKTANELEAARRKAAALDAMEKWGIGVQRRVMPGRVDWQPIYTTWHEPDTFNSPLEAIEAAVARLEQQEQTDGE